MAAFSRTTTSFGVPLFTARPTQSSTTRFGKPCSTMVGTSFSAAIRFGPVTASARELAGVDEIDHGSIVMNIYWLVPLRRSAMACGNCW